MVIAISSNTAWSVYNFRAGLIHTLQEEGYKVVVLAPEDDNSVSLRDMGCQVIDLPMDNKGSHPGRDLKLLLAYRRLYKLVKPQVALHYTIKPVIYGAIAAHHLGIPCINTITGLGTVFIRRNWLTQVIEYLYRFSQRQASQVFFQNKDDLALFLDRQLVSEDKALRIPGSGVNIARFKACSLPEGAPCFLMMSRLIKDKGVFEFIEAARWVKRYYPEARFQLLGRMGALNRGAVGQEDLDSWLAEGVVEYLGETSDVRPFIKQAHCVVLPSYREGLPRSLLEAASMQRPIITTDEPGCREVVDEGRNGYLCLSRDADDLASKIMAFLKLSNDERCSMAAASRRKAENEFSEYVVIEQYLKAINQHADLHNVEV